MNKKVCYKFVFLVFLVIACGCQKNVKNNQILKINFLQGRPESFHPHLIFSGHSMTFCKALFEGLTRINLQGDVELAIAKEIQVSVCGKKYTITLHKTNWSNGEEVTSKHFAQALKNAISLGSKCIRKERLFILKNGKKFFMGETSIENLGVYTPSNNLLIIELENPAPYFLQLLADPLFSPIYNDSELEPTVFNGPFLLRELDMNKKIHLVANPLYWDAKNIKLKEIEISLVKDPHSAIGMYEKGELDWIGSPFCELSEEIVQNSSSLQSTKAHLPFWLYCNTKSTKLCN